MCIHPRCAKAMNHLHGHHFHLNNLVLNYINSSSSHLKTQILEMGTHTFKCAFHFPLGDRARETLSALRCYLCSQLDSNMQTGVDLISLERGGFEKAHKRENTRILPTLQWLCQISYLTRTSQLPLPHLALSLFLSSRPCMAQSTRLSTSRNSSHVPFSNRCRTERALQRACHSWIPLC